MKRRMAMVMAVGLLGAAMADGPKCAIFEEGGFFVGCNYWAKNAGMFMWSEWRPDVMEAEMAALAKNGVTVMRVFPLWSDFQPLTAFLGFGGSFQGYLQRNRPLQNEAGVDEEMMKRFRHMCDVAQKHDIRLIVGIVTGWMSGRHFVPPVFEGKNVFTDPETVKWTTKFVKYFVREMKDHPAIVAWDYGNECNCLGEKSHAAFYNWLDHIGMAIRSQDATRPIVSGMHGNSTKESADNTIRMCAELSDILCTHPYAFYVPGCGKEAFDTMRTELHPTAESLLYRDLGGKPCFIEEIGNLGTSCNSDERTAAGMRCTMFSAWANDLKGCLWWCNSDQEVLDFPPYSRTANERELGMLRQDLTPKPVMLEMAAFQKFRASLPFAKLPQAKTDAVIVVPELNHGWISGFGAYLLARQAGFNPRFAGAEHALPESDFYIVASGTYESDYSYPAQKRFFEKAKRGATVLLVYAGGSRYTQLREQAGMKVDYCCQAHRQGTFTLDAFPDRAIPYSDNMTCRLIADGAEVLGKDAGGQPMFSRFRYGKGQVLLVNAPIDRLAVEGTGALTGERVTPYYLVFREAARLAGVKGRVAKGDCPWVGLTEHPRADGSAIVIAINFEPRAVDCPIALAGTLGAVWRGDVKADRIRLAANEAAVFEVR